MLHISSTQWFDVRHWDRPGRGRDSPLLVRRSRPGDPGQWWHTALIRPRSAVAQNQAVRLNSIFFFTVFISDPNDVPVGFVSVIGEIFNRRGELARSLERTTSLLLSRPGSSPLSSVAISQHQASPDIFPRRTIGTPNLARRDRGRGFNTEQPATGRQGYSSSRRSKS